MKQAVKKESVPEIKDYEIISKIGQGGIAEIFKARQISLDRYVAIKILFPKLTDDPDIVRRFDRESVTIASLNHPNIVHVIDKGEAADRYYFVMEYVDGTSFKDIIYSNKYTVRQKVEIIVMVLKALDYAHKNGVIHRDIKPANILIDRQGNALVADFGIAHLVNRTEPEMTSSEVIMGTIAYMSPEQRESAAAVDATSDIYSVGIMIYEILTGNRPVGHFKMPSVINPGIDRRYDDIISRCLAQNPEERYQKAVDLKDAILNVISGRAASSSKPKNDYIGVESFVGKSQFLDTLKETRYSSTMLVENKETHALFVIKKNNKSSSGYKEAKLLSSLKHKNIVNIFGAGSDGRRLVVVMEYISGGSLAERMVKTYSFKKAMAIITRVAGALEFANKNGIVHGNLRPSNILITRDEEVKITDFGLTPHYSLQEKNWYAPPEKRVSKQGDIYSLGVILYQMLYGKNPAYDRSSNLFIDKRDRTIPLAMGPILNKMLAIRVARRYRSVDEFLGEWDVLQRSMDDSKNLRIPVRSKAKSRDKKKYIMIAVSISIGVLVALAILFISGVLR
jgi:serine/threonine-protein kinase